MHSTISVADGSFGVLVLLLVVFTVASGFDDVPQILADPGRVCLPGS